MQKLKFFIVSVALGMVSADPAVGASEPEELVTLRGKFDNALGRATEALTFFWPSYKRALAELKPKAQAAGDLDGVLAVEAEIKMAERMSMGRNSPYEPLKALQASYETLRRELNQQISPEKNRLYGIYLAALQDLEVSLTKRSQLDEALLVRNAAQAAKNEMNARGPNAVASPSPAPMVATRPQGTDNTPLRPAGSPAGKGFTNSLGMQFVPVPGTQVMMCIHETRRKDYAAYASANPFVDGSWKNASKFKVPVGDGEEHPVVMVSWEEATAFCEWLSKKEGRVYRLPTDREWSYAVGIGEREPQSDIPAALSQKIPGVYPWGTEWPPPQGVGNFADSVCKEALPKDTCIEGYTDGFAATSPVTAFAPNRLGIYDLAGNLRQLCDDWCTPEQKERVTRGSSWEDNSTNVLQSSFRGRLEPKARRVWVGFRCVQVGGTGAPAR